MRSLAAAVRRGGVEAGLYVVWALLLIWPVTTALTQRAVGDGDARYWLWQGWRLARMVGGGELATRIPDVIWPYGFDLVPADGTIPSLVGLMWNFVAAPTLAHNLAVVTALVTNAAAGRHVAHQVTTRRWVLIVSALAFASAPALTMRLDGHFNLLFAFPLGLLLAAAIRIARGDEQPRVLALGAALALAYLSSGYYLVFGGLAVAAAIATARLPWRARSMALVRLAVAGLAALVLLAPLLVPKLMLERRELAAGGRTVSAGAAEFSADVASALVPPPGTVAAPDEVDRFHRRFGPNRMENTSFPGVLALLGLAGLVVLRSPLRRPLLGAAAALWLVSLGPSARVLGQAPLGDHEILPMAVLLELPGMSGVRAPNRASFALAAVAVAALAVVLGWVAERAGRRGQAAVVAVCAVLLVGGLRFGINWSAEAASPRVISALETLPDRAGDEAAVIHLPDDCLLNASQISLQVHHRLPVVGCHGFEATIPWNTGLERYFASEAWASLRCTPHLIASRPTPFAPDLAPSPEDADALTQELGVRFVVFDRQNRCPDRAGEVLAALRAAGRVVAQGERFVIVDLAS